MAYTSHGHHITTSPMDEERPAKVARCGGPGLCAVCTKEMGIWIENDTRFREEKERTEQYNHFDEFPTARKYVSKPVEIVAIQFTGGAGLGLDIVAWINANGGQASYIHAAEPYHPEGDEPSHDGWDERIQIQTLEGFMEVTAGTWLIQGTEGEFYPCKDSIFRKKYETKE